MKQAYRSKINLSKIVKFTILLYISQVAIGFVFYELSLFKTVSEILSTKQFYWLEKNSSEDNFQDGRSQFQTYQ